MPICCVPSCVHDVHSRASCNCQRCVGLALIATILIGVVGCPFDVLLCDDALYELTEPKPVVRLPRDESPHCTTGFEWWYYTGRLATPDNEVFGFEAVIFHIPRNIGFGLHQFWIGHYAVTNAQTGAFVYDQTNRAAWFDGRVQDGPGFDLWTEIIQINGSEGQDRVKAVMHDGRFKLNLRCVDVYGPVLHGDEGYTLFGDGGRTFYYSRPFMRAAGTMVIDGVQQPVTGQVWFDRQWGFDVSDPLQPWDWFSVRLDDGSALMLFEFPSETEGVVGAGTYIPHEPMREPVALAHADFTVTHTREWVSPRTNVRYATAWQIELPSEDLCLTVTAVAEDQELDTRKTTFNIYWEGLCDVTGTRGDDPVTGHAYMEAANAGLWPR